MTSSQETFDLIEQYLRGNLAEVDRIAFAEKMAIDTELANEVAVHRMTDELIIDYNLLKTRMEMSFWQKENDSKPGLSKPLIGLSIAILILAVGALFFQNKKNEQFTKPAISEQAASTQQPEPISQKQHSTPIQKEEEKPPAKTTQKLAIQSAEYAVSPGELTSLNSDPKPDLQRKNLTLAPTTVATPELELSLREPKICLETLPIDFVEFKGSCDGEMNGSIQFSDAALNGANPIAFSIDSGITYQNSRNFSLLENGTYHPILLVSSGCFFSYPQSILLISDADCRDIETFVINTTRNQFWEPMISLENANIQIRNSSGALVFSSLLDNQFRWYGNNIGGEILPMGDYIFSVEVSGKLIKSGTLTLLR